MPNKNKNYICHLKQRKDTVNKIQGKYNNKSIKLYLELKI